MTRTTIAKALAVATILAGPVLAPSSAEAVPLDPSPTHVARTWHPPTRTHTPRTWKAKPCQVWPRPASCPPR